MKHIKEYINLLNAKKIDWSNVPRELWHNDELGLTLLNIYPYLLPFVSERLRDNKDVVLSVLEQNIATNKIEHNFSKISLRLRSDFDIGIIAVKNNYNFIHLGDNLKSNKDIIKKALTSSDSCFFFESVSNELKNDTPFIEEMLTINANIFPYISNNLQHNTQLVTKVINKNPNLYCHLSESMQNDINILTVFIKKFENFSFSTSDDIHFFNKKLAIYNQYMQSIEMKKVFDSKPLNQKTIKF
jgi:hypothetical protein